MSANIMSMYFCVGDNMDENMNLALSFLKSENFIGFLSFLIIYKGTLD